jgi:hypothetical protein
VTDERATGLRRSDVDREESRAAFPVDEDRVSGPEELVRLAAANVAGVDHASLTVATLARRLTTVAGTDETATRLADMQAGIGSGPAFDPGTGTDLVYVADLADDARWPVFAASAVELGVRSLLSVRFHMDSLGAVALTFYARRAQAFPELDRRHAAVAASFVAVGLRSERYQRQAANLQIALESNRSIGIAVGILMAHELLTAEQAFTRLRQVSQRSHRKLREVAADVIGTGELPAPT